MTQQEFNSKILKITYGKAFVYLIGVVSICWSVIKTGIYISLSIAATNQALIERIDKEHNTNAVQDVQITNLKVTSDLHTMQIDNIRNR